jgi:diaminohydroxyphosphoribosylaminopyrimidine deaminase / 5-amino-6-(5-phosphoribosylamino)uracil reductase
MQPTPNKASAGAFMFDARDRRYMKRAIALAEKGIGLASPNPSVGCLIVREKEMIGSGWHEYDLMDHAEIRALHQAAGRSQNATAYVTLEPCCHYGRTPPCADSLINAGIARVVVAAIDPDPRVSGGGIERLRSAGIRVDVGLMAEQAEKIIEPYACYVSTGLPFVISKIGMSLDGKAGTGLPDGRWITSPEGREFAHYLRRQVDALLVGVGTVLADDPELTYRGKAPKRKPLLRVVLDPSLRTPLDARIFQTVAQAPILLFCNQQASNERRRELKNRGAEIIEVPMLEEELDLNAVLKELGKKKILGLLVEGGGRTHWTFLSHKLVDAFYFIIAPLVLGGTNSIPSIAGTGYGTAEDSPRFKVRSCFTVGPDIVLECYPYYSRSIISPWLSRETSAFHGPGFLPSSRRK